MSAIQNSPFRLSEKRSTGVSWEIESQVWHVTFAWMQAQTLRNFSLFWRCVSRMCKQLKCVWSLILYRLLTRLVSSLSASLPVSQLDFVARGPPWCSTKRTTLNPPRQWTYLALHLHCVAFMIHNDTNSPTRTNGRCCVENVYSKYQWWNHCLLTSIAPVSAGDAKSSKLNRILQHQWIFQLKNKIWEVFCTAWIQLPKGFGKPLLLRPSKAKSTASWRQIKIFNSLLVLKLSNTLSYRRQCSDCLKLRAESKFVGMCKLYCSAATCSRRLWVSTCVLQVSVTIDAIRQVMQCSSSWH